MPAVSQAQQRFAAMSKSAKGRAALRASGKKPMPNDVAGEFANTARKNLPKRVRKKT
jgi:hypothetical protein